MTQDEGGFLERLWYSKQTSPLSIPLALASLPFRAAVAMRGAAYSAGVFSSARIEGAKVVSVGNLTVGGAGKTPVVIFLARWAIAAGVRVAVLTRGYGRSSTRALSFDGSLLPPVEEAGDEPRLIARRCPAVRVYVDADRVSSARRAREHGATLLLLDDGFQHRRLARDVDVVVVDQLGNGHLMPWGPLREPASALARASFVWLRGQGAPLGGKPVVRAEHAAVGWVDPAGAERPLESLRGQSVIALAGIARPRGFLDSLVACGATVTSRQLFADHHRFSADELEACVAEAKRSSARIVTTEKDAERLPDGFEAWRLRLGVRVTEGLEALGAALGLDPKLLP